MQLSQRIPLLVYISALIGAGLFALLPLFTVYLGYQMWGDREPEVLGLLIQNATGYALRGLILGGLVGFLLVGIRKVVAALVNRIRSPR